MWFCICIYERTTTILIQILISDKGKLFDLPHPTFINLTCTNSTSIIIILFEESSHFRIWRSLIFQRIPHVLHNVNHTKEMIDLYTILTEYHSSLHSPSFNRRGSSSTVPFMNNRNSELRNNNTICFKSWYTHSTMNNPNPGNNSFDSSNLMILSKQNGFIWLKHSIHQQWQVPHFREKWGIIVCNSHNEQCYKWNYHNQELKPQFHKDVP